MDKNKLPPLNAVRAFDAAARLGSYVAAAEALHVTQPAITRHVKILEDWLGVKLFTRTPRGVELTESGRLYFSATTKAFQALLDGGRTVADARRERWITITCAPAFASRWLTPRLPALYRARPDLRISIEPVTRITDLVIQGSDLCIAYGMDGEFPFPHRLLAHPAVIAVCSPAYLARTGECNDLQILSRKDLIHVDNGEWWRTWFTELGLPLDISSATAHTSNDIALRLAEQGRGVALGTELIVAEQLRSGALVQVLNLAVPLEYYQAVTPTKDVSSDVEWIIEWLAEELRSPFGVHLKFEPKPVATVIETGVSRATQIS